MKAIAAIDKHGAITLSGITSPVPWWSFSKTVLSIAALRLVENGAATLDDVLPGEAFSLRRLLRHEAGLPDYGCLSCYHEDVAAGKTPWPVERLLQAVDVARLRYEPGTAWAYSNIGYLKVSQLIARAACLPIGEALAHIVFRPAGLQSARLAVQPGDLAGVQMGGAGAYHPGWVYHGLVVGTAGDAARLLWLLDAGHILKPATFAEMKTGRALPDHRSTHHPDPAYGLGLMLRGNHPDDYPHGHSGQGPGSRIAVYAKGGRAVAVWTQLPSDIDADAEAFRLLG